MTREDPRRRLGAAGERLAAAHLEARGFRLLDRNFRTRYGELDLVAVDARYLVFCDVYKGKIEPYRGMAVKVDSKLPDYIRGALQVKDRPLPQRLP